jgi:hypothetical protein
LRYTEKSCTGYQYGGTARITQLTTSFRRIFCTFINEEDAEIVKAALNGCEFEGHRLDVYYGEVDPTISQLTIVHAPDDRETAPGTAGLTEELADFPAWITTGRLGTN